MRKFQCLLFVLKSSYICYNIIYMTEPLKICTYQAYEKVVYKHSETIEYVKNYPTFWEIYTLHG